MSKTQFKKNFGKKVIFGGLPTFFVNQDFTKISYFPILRKFPKFDRVMQSTWNLDRIIILIKETFPENFIKIQPQEGIFWKFLIFWQNLWSRGWGKIMKSTFPKSDFDEIFRKRFFYQYYDFVQFSTLTNFENLVDNQLD